MQESIVVLSDRLARRARVFSFVIGAGLASFLVVAFWLLAPSDPWYYALLVAMLGVIALVSVGIAASSGRGLRNAAQVFEGLPDFQVAKAHAVPTPIVGTTTVRAGEPAVAVAYGGEEGGFEAAIPSRVQAHISELDHGLAYDLIENAKLWGNPRIANQTTGKSLKAELGKELTFEMRPGWDDDTPEVPQETRIRFMAGIEELFSIREALEAGKLSRTDAPTDVRVRDAGPWRIVGWCPRCRAFRDEPTPKGARKCSTCGGALLAVTILR